MITRQDLKSFRSLNLKKFRDESGLFLVEGVRGVGEALAAGAAVQAVVHSHAFGGTPQAPQLLAAARARDLRVEAVSDRDLASVSDTVHAQGVVAVVQQAPVEAGQVLVRGAAPALVVALDAVADPGNLGSILRTCDWFGVDGVLLGRNCVDLHNPKAVRATMGSLFHLPVAEGIDLAASAGRMREADFALAVADAGGDTLLPNASLPRRLVIVFGNEAWGVSEDIRRLAGIRLAVRRFGKAESLNVGVACGVILSALRQET